MLVENNASLNGPTRLLLTFAGWQHYKALKHAEVQSRTAFMAMQFDDDELNQMVNDSFKPAVARTGFELRVLTDGQPAGLIDDQLRVHQPVLGLYHQEQQSKAGICKFPGIM